MDIRIESENKNSNHIQYQRITDLKSFFIEDEINFINEINELFQKHLKRELKFVFFKDYWLYFYLCDDFSDRRWTGGVKFRNKKMIFYSYQKYDKDYWKKMKDVIKKNKIFNYELHSKIVSSKKIDLRGISSSEIFSYSKYS